MAKVFTSSTRELDRLGWDVQNVSFFIFVIFEAERTKEVKRKIINSKEVGMGKLK